MESYDCFDELHVVSDLHLGGVPGRQIFRQTKALAGWIEKLATENPERRVGLVLNGDIVDFLADKDARYFDEKGAVKKLGAVIDAFTPIFHALKNFTGRDKRCLVLVLGNHDVELALPHVTKRLLDEICQDDAARGRVRLALDGTGYTCMVGDRRVYCVHGNDADPWNWVDHGAVRRISAAKKRGCEPQAWFPNAGTKLVIDVMNKVKKDWPFVDLLKPETQAALPILVALATKLILEHASGLARLLPAYAGGHVRAQGHQAGLLGPEAERELSPQASLSLLLADEAESLSRWEEKERPSREVETLLKEVEAVFKSPRKPVDLTEDADLTLGFGSIVWNKFRNRPIKSALREALEEWLRNDNTYDISREDDQFQALDQMIGDDIDFIVAGHTHLRRAIRRHWRKGFYFNSGTWIRLLEIEKKMLESDDSFTKVYEALQDKSLSALDEFDLQQRTVVAILASKNGVRGELRQIDEHGNVEEVLFDSTQERV